MPTKYIEDGKTIVRYTEEELRALKSQTDWKRVADMTDEELTANALSVHDNPPLPDDFFEKAKRVRLEDLLPETKERVCIPPGSGRVGVVPRPSEERVSDGH